MRLQGTGHWSARRTSLLVASVYGVKRQSSALPSISAVARSSAAKPTVVIRSFSMRRLCEVEAVSVEVLEKTVTVRL